MSQKKVIDIWKRAEYLLIKKHRKIDQFAEYRNFLHHCWQLQAKEQKDK